VPGDDARAVWHGVVDGELVVGLERGRLDPHVNEGAVPAVG
jgi:hypothetical protein